MVAFRLEVLGAQAGGNLFQLLRRRAALSRMGQRIFVDVGRVDLGALSVFGGAQHLAEEHGDAVRLLARGDPGTPDTDGLIGRFALDDPGKNLGSHIVPGGGIPKIAGDIDQDRVEQGAEFVGMGLQILEIRTVALDPDLRHPFSDPA